MYACSIVATLMCVVILGLVERYEKARHVGQESKVLNVTINRIVSDIDPYRQLFRKNKAYLSTFYIDYDYDRETTVVSFVVLIPTKGNLLPVMEQMRSIEPTRSITLSSQTDI